MRNDPFKTLITKLQSRPQDLGLHVRQKLRMVLHQNEQQNCALICTHKYSLSISRRIISTAVHF